MSSRTSDLKEFLRARRDAVRPSDVGLPVYPGRRVAGLRREEVAQLAGVSVDYYTRLEQGRLTSASEGVIAAICEALKLDSVERQYLHDLLRPAPRPNTVPQTQNVRPALQKLMDGFDTQATFILGRRNEVLASNALLDALLTPFNDRAPDDRNLLRWLLTDPTARDLYLDWEEVTSGVVGVLRAEAGRRPKDPELLAFVAEMTEVSPEFRLWWAEHSVNERSWGHKRFEHPVVGRVDIDYEALTMPGDPDQVLFVYTGTRPSDVDALRILASWASEQKTTTAQVAPE